MRTSLWIGLLGACVVSFAAPARADFKLAERLDVIVLKEPIEGEDGEKITILEGTILSETPTEIVIVVGPDEKTVPRTNIRSVIKGADAIHLVDGGQVRGQILVQGIKGIVVLVGEKEKIVPREQVLRIEMGSGSGRKLQPFRTDTLLGMRIVAGRGSSEDAAAADDPAANGQAPAGKGGPPQKVDELTVADVQRAAKANAQLANIVRGLGGPEKALEMIKQDAFMRGQVERLLREQGGANPKARRGARRPKGPGAKQPAQGPARGGKRPGRAGAPKKDGKRPAEGDLNNLEWKTTIQAPRVKD